MLVFMHKILLGHNFMTKMGKLMKNVSFVNQYFANKIMLVKVKWLNLA